MNHRSRHLDLRRSRLRQLHRIRRRSHRRSAIRRPNLTDHPPQTIRQTRHHRRNRTMRRKQRPRLRIMPRSRSLALTQWNVEARVWFVARVNCNFAYSEVMLRLCRRRVNVDSHLGGVALNDPRPGVRRFVGSSFRHQQQAGTRRDRLREGDADRSECDYQGGEFREPQHGVSRNIWSSDTRQPSERRSNIPRKLDRTSPTVSSLWVFTSSRPT